MTTKFEYKGKWKSVNSKEWINGTLFFDPDIGGRLELFGFLDLNPNNSSEKVIVHGKTTEGEITLIDLWHRYTRSGEQNVNIGIYEPILIIVGHHFETIEEINFKNVIYRTFNLFQWFNNSGIKFDHTDNGDQYSIIYNKIKNIDFKLHDKCIGKIIFDSPVDSHREYNKKELYEQAYIKLEYEEKTHFEEILNDSKTITDFITLATLEQSYPMAITFIDDDFQTDSRYHTPKFIKCFYQNSNYSSKHKLRYSHEHLIKFEKIQDTFPSIIKNWYEMHSYFEPVFILMLRFFLSKYNFSVDKFVDNIRAIESYHRIKFDNCRISQEDYKKLVDGIMDSVKLNDEDTIWLTNKLKGNEPSLNKRLKELIRSNKNSYLEKYIPQVKSFCLNVVNSRNYYTHYDESLKEKALKNKELYKVTQTLRGILYTCILTDLGMENSQFEKGLKYNLYH